MVSDHSFSSVKSERGWGRWGGGHWSFDCRGGAHKIPLLLTGLGILPAKYIPGFGVFVDS